MKSKILLLTIIVAVMVGAGTVLAQTITFGVYMN